jgi:hypothetical protein
MTAATLTLFTLCNKNITAEPWEINNYGYHAAHEWIHEAVTSSWRKPNIRPRLSLVYITTPYFSKIHVNINFPSSPDIGNDLLPSYNISVRIPCVQTSLRRSKDKHELNT